MKGSESIGVAVVGLGVGEQHARAYAASPDCRLRWLLDLDASRAANLASSFGQCEVATSYEQIIGDPSVGIVSIASYDDAHYGQVLGALKAGKHVFVEKPLCLTLEELRQIKRAWASHGGRVKLTSNLILRAAPLYQWLKQTVAAGDIGTLYAFDGDYLYGRLNKITDGWRGDVENYSVMLGGGIHMVDLMLWLACERPVSVMAAGNRISTRNTDFRYNDFVAGTFEFASGLVGRVTANFGCVHRHQHVLRAFGTGATFLYDDGGARLHTTREENSIGQALNLSPFARTKGDLIPAFVSAVQGSMSMEEQTQMAFDAISVCIACDEAVRVHAKVEVEYV
jgi:predicted dehydrogenase